MVVYGNYRSKEEYGWDGSRYRSFFNLDIKKEDLVNLNPRLSNNLYSLVNNDYENILTSLPTRLIDEILQYSIDNNEHIEIDNRDKTIYTSTTNSIVGNPRIVSEMIKNKNEWLIIKPIFDKYFNAKDSNNLEKITIALSLFFTLNELININKNSYSQHISFNTGEINAIIIINEIHPFVGKSVPVKDNKLFNGLMEQYHRLQFANYKHTEKLVDFIVEDLMWSNENKPSYCKNNDQGQQRSLIIIEENGKISEIADKIYSRI